MGFAAYPASSIIFRQGDFGDHFYIILSGAVDVSVDDEKQVLVAYIKICHSRFSRSKHVA